MTFKIEELLEVAYVKPYLLLAGRALLHVGKLEFLQHDWWLIKLRFNWSVKFITRVKTLTDHSLLSAYFEIYELSSMVPFKSYPPGCSCTTCHFILWYKVEWLQLYQFITKGIKSTNKPKMSIKFGEHLISYYMLLTALASVVLYNMRHLYAWCGSPISIPFILICPLRS